VSACPRACVCACARACVYERACARAAANVVKRLFFLNPCGDTHAFYAGTYAMDAVSYSDATVPLLLWNWQIHPTPVA